MPQQITVLIPDDLVDWLNRVDSKNEFIVAALQEARRRATREAIEREYARVPAEAPDCWGNPVEFSEANRDLTWSEDER